MQSRVYIARVIIFSVVDLYLLTPLLRCQERKRMGYFFCGYRIQEMSTNREQERIL